MTVSLTKIIDMAGLTNAEKIELVGILLLEVSLNENDIKFDEMGREIIKYFKISKGA